MFNYKKTDSRPIWFYEQFLLNLKVQVITMLFKLFLSRKKYVFVFYKANIADTKT